MVEVVARPSPRRRRALVIAGSDQRAAPSSASTTSPSGSASRPGTGGPTCRCAQSAQLFVASGRCAAPASRPCKYRGIFLNDEAPALSGWVRRDVRRRSTRKFYAQRLRAAAPPARQLPLAGDVGQRVRRTTTAESRRLADEYGIVMGTSHHEPMMRAHVEWRALRQGPGTTTTQRATSCANSGRRASGAWAPTRAS